jgi:uncharacterized protein YceH (UPF0502 family)
MNIELNAVEARIIGSLMEKSVVTPEQYPLSLNALVNACNQKSSREPVMTLGEAEVQDAVDALKKRYLIREKSGFGSRVAKYHYRLGNDEIGGFRLTDAQRAVVCLLLLRGPQTAGELRSRAGRLHDFADVGEVEATLASLLQGEHGPLVVDLGREPGRREARFAHLLSGIPAPAARTTPPAAARFGQTAPTITDVEARLAALEARLDAMERALRALAPAATDS